jgi:hypothetical protein
LMHRCHGMRRSRFSRDSTAAAACSTVRFRPWGALTASQVPQDVPLPPPTTLRPSAAMLAAQRAILHSAPRALALGPGRSRQRATPRHVAARLAVCFALPSPQRTPAPSPSFSCAWAQSLLPAGGAGAQRGCPQASKRMCGPGASASARLAPWKDRLRCTFPRRRPRAICGHPPLTSAHWTPLLVAPRFALSAHSEPLRSRLDPLDRE